MIGIVFTAIPFIKALNPSANAGSTLLQINISNMKPGSFLVQEDPMRGYFKAQYLIIKNYGNEIYVYRVPVREGQAMLPDISWWRWGALCQNFSPDMEGDSIKANGYIQCQDKNRPDMANSTEEWKWTYSGKNMGKYTSDMDVPKYTIENGYIVIGKT